MRVPPDQSRTARETAANAASGAGDRSSIVTLVKRVANRKASTRRALLLIEWAKCSNVRE